MQYWRDMLLAAAQKEGYAVVDMFSLSLPHAMEALGLDSVSIVFSLSLLI
jgi:hypothetical protein